MRQQPWVKSESGKKGKKINTPHDISAVMGRAMKSMRPSMAQERTRSVLQQLQRAVLVRDDLAGDDAQLLEAFFQQGSELALEVLLRRHGPMVMGVCRRVLHHSQDAEDAFQATFSCWPARATLSRRRICSATGSMGSRIVAPPAHQFGQSPPASQREAGSCHARTRRRSGPGRS